MKLSIEQIIQVNVGLAALDGYQKIIKDGERERIAQELYKLGGGLRLCIAKNKNRIETILTAFQKARNDLIYQYGKGTAVVPDDKAEAFSKDERPMLEMEHDIEISEIDVDQLKLDENPIPGTVLSALMPILKGA